MFVDPGLPACSRAPGAPPWNQAFLVKAVAAPLGWLGRQGTRAVAASLLLALLPNPLAPVLKPFVPETIFVLLVLAFLRVDVTRVVHHACRPKPLLLALGWTMLVVPFLVGLFVDAAEFQSWAPGLDLALVLMSAAPPIMSAPAFAYLLGLDGALSLALLVGAMVVTPLTAPIVVAGLLTGELAVSSVALALRLFGLLAGSAALAFALRRVLGIGRIAAAQAEIDGLNVVLLFAFAVALMDGVAARLIGSPGLVLGLIALSFAVSLSIVALTVMLMQNVPRPDALTLGLAAGNRNMGLMLAALGGQVPELTWLFFALAQFPIYILPQLLRWIAPGLVPPRHSAD
jgi:hypothetical protein